MKVLDNLTIRTPPSSLVASFHLRYLYCYYHPCLDDPKRHYGFKPGLFGKSVSLGVDILNWEMFDDDWGLESKEVSPLGEELSLFDRPNEVERGWDDWDSWLESPFALRTSKSLCVGHLEGHMDGNTMDWASFR
ncbi:hypothetical protein Tco_0981655 [Tanacetum coccineum]